MKKFSIKNHDRIQMSILDLNLKKINKTHVEQLTVQYKVLVVAGRCAARSYSLPHFVLARSLVVRLGPRGQVVVAEQVQLHLILCDQIGDQRDARTLTIASRIYYERVAQTLSQHLLPQLRVIVRLRREQIAHAARQILLEYFRREYFVLSFAFVQRQLVHGDQRTNYSTLEKKLN